MRKPKISDKYDRESYIKGFKKGWGQCLGIALHAIETQSITSAEEFKEAVLAKHPYHTLTSRVKPDG